MLGPLVRGLSGRAPGDRRDGAGFCLDRVTQTRRVTFRAMWLRLGLSVLVGVSEGPKLRSSGVCGEGVATQHVDVF